MSGRRKLRFRNPADGRDILTFDEWHDDAMRRLDEAKEIHEEAKGIRAEAKRRLRKAKESREGAEGIRAEAEGLIEEVKSQSREAREDRADAQRFFEQARELDQRSGWNSSYASALVKDANSRAREALHRERAERSARLAAERRITELEAELARRN